MLCSYFSTMHYLVHTGQLSLAVTRKSKMFGNLCSVDSLIQLIVMVGVTRMQHTYIASCYVPPDTSERGYADRLTPGMKG